MSNYPPIYFDWVERDADNVDLVFRGSRVTLFRIRKILVSGLIFGPKKYQYMTKSPLTNPDSAAPIGGFYTTLEEAKNNVVRQASIILRGTAEPVNEPDNDEATAEPSEEQKRATEREIEQSWAANPDRMGGQFTQDEINDNGWR
jgi:hypothetical protein